MGSDEILVDRVGFKQVREQRGKQRNVAIRFDRKVQVDNVRSHCPPRIDEDDLHFGPLVFGSGDTLIEDGMAPGEIRTDKNDEVGNLEIFIAARNGVRSERALVPGNGGSHAEARIGIDVRGADEALHQLVSDIVIFRQQLTRDIKRH